MQANRPSTFFFSYVLSCCLSPYLTLLNLFYDVCWTVLTWCSHCQMTMTKSLFIVWKFFLSGVCEFWASASHWVECWATTCQIPSCRTAMGLSYGGKVSYTFTLFIRFKGFLILKRKGRFSLDLCKEEQLKRGTKVTEKIQKKKIEWEQLTMPCFIMELNNSVWWNYDLVVMLW